MSTASQPSGAWIPVTSIDKTHQSVIVQLSIANKGCRQRTHLGLQVQAHLAEHRDFVLQSIDDLCVALQVLLHAAVCHLREGNTHKGDRVSTREIDTKVACSKHRERVQSVALAPYEAARSAGRTNTIGPSSPTPRWFWSSDQTTGWRKKKSVSHTTQGDPHRITNGTHLSVCAGDLDVGGRVNGS